MSLTIKEFTEDKGLIARRALARFIHEHGLATISVQYSGGGDSGGFDEDSLPDGLGELKLRVPKADDGLTLEEISINDVLYSIANAYMPTGYEDNLGGGGQVVFYENGNLDLDHYSNIDVPETVDFDLSHELAEQLPEIKAVFDRMAELKVTELKVDYGWQTKIDQVCLDDQEDDDEEVDDELLIEALQALGRHCQANVYDSHGDFTFKPSGVTWNQTTYTEGRDENSESFELADEGLHTMLENQCWSVEAPDPARDGYPEELTAAFHQPKWASLDLPDSEPVCLRLTDTSVELVRQDQVLWSAAMDRPQMMYSGDKIAFGALSVADGERRHLLNVIESGLEIRELTVGPADPRTWQKTVVAVPVAKIGFEALGAAPSAIRDLTAGYVRYLDRMAAYDVLEQAVDHLAIPPGDVPLTGLSPKTRSIFESRLLQDIVQVEEGVAVAAAEANDAADTVKPVRIGRRAL